MDNLHIKDGEYFTKNQLKSRLNQMHILFDTTIQRKSYFVDLYNIALKKPENKKKIEELLCQANSEYMKYKKKRSRYTSEDAVKDLKVEGKLGKIESYEIEKVPSVNAFDKALNVKTLSKKEIRLF